MIFLIPYLSIMLINASITGCTITCNVCKITCKIKFKSRISITRLFQRLSLFELYIVYIKTYLFLFIFNYFIQIFTLLLIIGMWGFVDNNNFLFFFFWGNSKAVNQGHRPKHYELHDNDITIHDDSEIFIQQYRENVWVGTVLYSMKPTTWKEKNHAMCSFYTFEWFLNSCTLKYCKTLLQLVWAFGQILFRTFLSHDF